MHYLRKLLENGEQGKEYLALESGIQLKEPEIQLTIGIWNLSSMDKESEIQYVKSEIWNLESGIWNLESGIFIVDS